ncbi:MAG: hypothetical protein ACKPEN_16735 [Planktothrix sp.]|uniref:hypothetical protein n=1 Tax=Planktothrix sp. TaxID=3088171 RepID=UPI0038D49423
MSIQPCFFIIPQFSHRIQGISQISIPNNKGNSLTVSGEKVSGPVETRHGASLQLVSVLMRLT